jgi:hypothetical protein
MAISEELDALEPFIGQWQMTMGTTSPRDAPHAFTSFAWLPGRRFLIQRWEVEHPDAPDGLAIIGFDSTQTSYVQHYFDSRGVVRTYVMDFADNVWTLLRIAAHSDFSQRFRGCFGADGGSIVGRWETSDDNGTSWSPDFDLTYIKVE